MSSFQELVLQFATVWEGKEGINQEVQGLSQEINSQLVVLPSDENCSKKNSSPRLKSTKLKD